MRQLVVFDARHGRTALNILHEQVFLKARRSRHDSPAVIHHEGAACIDGAVETADRRHASEPEAALDGDGAEVTVLHGGYGRCLGSRDVERSSLEVNHEVAPGRQELARALDVERDRAANAVDIEDGRRPQVVIARLLATNRQERAQRRHIPVFEQKHLEHVRTLVRDEGGDERGYVELGKPHRHAAQAGDQIVQEVRGFDDRARRGTREQGNRRAEKPSPLLVREGRLVLDARADSVDVTQTHIDLRDCNLHRTLLLSLCPTAPRTSDT